MGRQHDLDELQPVCPPCSSLCSACGDHMTAPANPTGPARSPSCCRSPHSLSNNPSPSPPSTPFHTLCSLNVCMIGCISMHVFVTTLCPSGDKFFERPKYFTTGPNKLYLVSNSFVLFFSYCTGFWLEWLLVVGKRELAEEGVAGIKGWYGIANRRASRQRIRGQAVGVGRREQAEEGVAKK